MTNEERTKQFVSKINKNAMQLEAELSEKTEQEINRLFESGKAEIDAAVQLHIGRENDKALKESSLKINVHRAEIKQETIAKRNAICDAVFAEVGHNIRKYAESEEYRKAIAELLAQIVKRYGKIEKLNVAEKDLPLYDDIHDATVNVSDDILLGGFEAYVSGGSRFIDSTLDTRFNNEKVAFLSTDKLIIK